MAAVGHDTPHGRITGYRGSAVTVWDLPSALAFYRDGLGLRAGAERSEPSPAGAAVTTVELELPGSTASWSLEEHRGVERHGASARLCDIGFAHLCLYVDAAGALVDSQRARGYGSRRPVVEVSRGPHAGAKAVYTLDPGGFAVELYQAPGTGAGAGEVTGFYHHGLTVGDMDETLRFWVEGLGAEVESRGERTGADVEPIVGIRPEALTAVFLSLPGGVKLELFEYRGIERHSASARDEDPASSRITLEVDDIGAIGSRLGLPEAPASAGVARVTDPNGYPVVLREAGSRLAPGQ